MLQCKNSKQVYTTQHKGEQIMSEFSVFGWISFKQVNSALAFPESTQTLFLSHFVPV